MDKKEIKLNIKSCDDRENMVIALVNNGYRVWIEEEENSIHRITYFVVFSINK